MRLDVPPHLQKSGPTDPVTRSCASPGLILSVRITTRPQNQRNVECPLGCYPSAEASRREVHDRRTPLLPHKHHHLNETHLWQSPFVLDVDGHVTGVLQGEYRLPIKVDEIRTQVEMEVIGIELIEWVDQVLLKSEGGWICVNPRSGRRPIHSSAPGVQTRGQPVNWFTGGGHTPCESLFAGSRRRDLAFSTLSRVSMTMQ